MQINQRDQRLIQVERPLPPAEETAASQEFKLRESKKARKARKKQLQKFTSKHGRKVLKLPSDDDRSRQQQLKKIQHIPQVSMTTDYEAFKEHWNNKWEQVAGLNVQLHDQLREKQHVLQAVVVRHRQLRRTADAHANRCIEQENIIYEKELEIKQLTSVLWLFVAVFSVVVIALTSLVITLI